MKFRKGPSTPLVVRSTPQQNIVTRLDYIIKVSVC